MRVALPQRPRYQREWRQGEDVGLFGPHSMVWRVHRDPSSLIGGLRALLIQALHPTAMAAVDKFSDYKSDPWARLNRTSEYLTVTTFGDTATALAAAERLRAIHRRMSGTDPVTGRAYRVDDADLLLWVHNVEVHSFLAAYRAYGGRLSDAETDRYVREMVAHAELVGLKDHDVPHDMSALRDYLRSFDGMALTPAARAGVKYVLAPPMPLALRPLWAIPAAAAVALLPRKVRDLYGLPWSEVATPVVRLYTRTTLSALKTLFPPPPPVREALARAERLAA
ncbi:MAG: oxygenase MpaB family protein [Actinomycetota bacterium]